MYTVIWIYAIRSPQPVDSVLPICAETLLEPSRALWAPYVPGNFRVGPDRGNWRGRQMRTLSLRKR